MANNNEFDSVKGIDFDMENKGSCNKLLTAVMNGDERAVKSLLAKKWSPNSVDNQGRTAVHLASRSASLYPILQLLLKAGGYADHVTHSGVTPLCLAAYSGVEKSVALLLESGASIDLKNHIEAGPLHFAANGPSPQVVKLLMDAGSDVNATDFYQMTPLMIAVKNNNHSIVRCLVEKGADVMLKDRDERTAMHYACDKDNLEIFNTLVKGCPQSQALGDLVDKQGWTLLMIAAQFGACRIVDRLLEMGSDPCRTNNNELCALHLAAHNSQECFEILLRRTPVDFINSSCVYLGRPITNSLPCLLIHKCYLSGLKRLFETPGLDPAVLVCPVVKQRRAIPPIPFCFFSEISSVDFCRCVINLYSEAKIPLDPEFNKNADTLTCLESLTSYHVLHSHSTDTFCQCAQLMIHILERGASPDPYYRPEDLCSNNVLWFVCVNGCTQALSLLLKYSDYLEPHSVLRNFTRLILDTNMFASSRLITRTITFLCRYMEPWRVAACKQLVSSCSLSDHPDIERISCAYHRRGASFPSLMFLCRSVIRDCLHQIQRSFGSQPYPDFIKYTRQGSVFFRGALKKLGLPESLHTYLEYSDIINDVKNHPKYPSFEE